VRDASRLEVDTERDASDFDVAYYGKLLEKAWEEIAVIFRMI
jgi:DNA polymerase, archaea type